MFYRRSRGDVHWHWHESCPRWPSHQFDVAKEDPRVGKMCEDCLQLDTGRSTEDNSINLAGESSGQ